MIYRVDHTFYYPFKFYVTLNLEHKTININYTKKRNIKTQINVTSNLPVKFKLITLSDLYTLHQHI